MASLILPFANCAWLKHNSPCFRRLELYISNAGTASYSNVALEGGWLSGKVGYNCGSDPYCAFNAPSPYAPTCAIYNYCWIDVWRAKAAGLWASSVAFTVHNISGQGTSHTITMYAQKEGIYSGANPKKIANIPPGSCACPNNPWATVTVYDDGTVTVA